MLRRAFRAGGSGVVRVCAWGGVRVRGAGAGWGVTRLGRERRRDVSPALCSKGLWAGIVVAWSFGGRWRGFWCSCVEDVRPRRLATGAVVGGGF